MSSQQVDSKLLALLKDIPYFSRLGTCLSIRLADYAAQLCGYRSTRQIDDYGSEEVSDQFYILVIELQSHIDEVLYYIDGAHAYKQGISELNDDDLELLLEDTLFDMVYFNCSYIFKEKFFIDE